MIVGCRIGRRYRDVSWEATEVHAGNRKAVAALGRILEGEALMVLLYGPPGTGKTHLAVALLRALDAKWPTGLYVYWTLPELFRARLEAQDGDRPDPMDRCREAHVLVLDDLGAENDTEAFRRALYDLLDHRYRECLPTIIITNHDLQVIERRYGSPILSRLGGADAMIILVGGGDRRLSGDGEARSWVDLLPEVQERKRRKELDLVRAEWLEAEVSRGDA